MLFIDPSRVRVGKAEARYGSGEMGSEAMPLHCESPESKGTQVSCCWEDMIEEFVSFGIYFECCEW